MPKRFDQTGLQQDDDHSPEEWEAAERQLQNLRRWVDVDLPNQTQDEAESPEPVLEPPTDREESRQRLQQIQAEVSRQPKTLVSDDLASNLAADVQPSEPLADQQTKPTIETDSPPGSLIVVGSSPLTSSEQLSDRNPSSQEQLAVSDRSQPPTPKQRRVVKGDPYQEQIKQDLNNIFEKLDLQEPQKHYLRSRWLDQLLWMEKRATQTRDLYYKLRLTTIIGGVIVPALVSLSFVDNNPTLKRTVVVSTFVLSQIVAISAATEQFFNYGDRWRHYRRTVESLKTQGWQFFELSDRYQSFQTHNQAFSAFATQVEQILQRNVEVYATQVTQQEAAQATSVTKLVKRTEDRELSAE